MHAERLPPRTKLGFGVGSIAEASITIAFNTFNFLFYNQVLGLSGTLCGLAVTIAMVVDALADPLIGSLSDRTHSRLGRRHPFLLAAPIPLAVSFYLLFSPPEGLSEGLLFVWFTVFSLIGRTSMSVYNVAHLALGAELSRDYRERSVIMSYNVVFHVVGGSLAYFFGWTWFSKIEGGSTVRAGYAPMALAVGVLAAVAIFASAYFTRDRIRYLPAPPRDQPPFSMRELFREIQACLRNRNYTALLLGFLLLSATLGTRETLQPLTSLFFWQLPEKGIRVFGLASPPAFVLAFFLTARLHARYDKRATILASVVVVVLCVALPIPLHLLGAFPTELGKLTAVLFAIVFLFYLAFAILSISLLSALADIADEHELSSGKRQEGIFFAARALFLKAASGMGHIVGGVAIDAIGFPKGAVPGQVARDIVVQLGIIDGPVIAVPALLSVIYFMRYRLDRASHAATQQQLLARAPADAAVVVAPVEAPVVAQPAQ